MPPRSRVTIPSDPSRAAMTRASNPSDTRMIATVGSRGTHREYR
jgi:hypothetical protein